MEEKVGQGRRREEEREREKESFAEIDGYETFFFFPQADFIPSCVLHRFVPYHTMTPVADAGG